MLLRNLLIPLACLSIQAGEDLLAATAFTDEAAKLARGLVDTPQRAASLREIVRLRAALPVKAHAESALAEFAQTVADIPEGSRLFGTWVVEETQRVSGATAALMIATELHSLSRNSAITAVFVRDMDAGANPIFSVRTARSTIGKPEGMSEVLVHALGIIAKGGDKAAIEELTGAMMDYAAVTNDPVEPVVSIAIALAQVGQTKAATTVIEHAAITAQRYRPEYRDAAIREVAEGWGGIGNLKQAIATARTQVNPFMQDHTIRFAFNKLLQVQGPGKAAVAIGLLPIAADRSSEICSIACSAAACDQITMAESLAAQVEEPNSRGYAQSALMVAYAKTGAKEKATAAAGSAVSAAFLTTDHRKRALLLSVVVTSCIRCGIMVPERDKIVADMVAWPERTKSDERTFAASFAAEALWLLGADAEAKSVAKSCGEKECVPCERAVVFMHKNSKSVPAGLILALRDAISRSSHSAAAEALGTIAWVQAESGDLAGSLITAAAITNPHEHKTAIARVAKTMAARGDVAGVRRLLLDGASDSVGVRIAGLVAAAGELVPKLTVNSK